MKITDIRFSKARKIVSAATAAVAVILMLSTLLTLGAKPANAAAGSLNASIAVSTTGGFTAMHGVPNPQPVVVSYTAVSGFDGSGGDRFTFNISSASVVGTQCAFTPTCTGITATYTLNGTTTTMTSNAPSAGIRFVTSSGSISFQFGPNQIIPAGARVEITMAAGRIQVSSSSVLLSTASGSDTQSNNVPFTDPPVVTFNANFGSSPETMTQSGAKFSSAPLNGTFTRAGYTLAGWTTNADGTGTSYTPTQNYTFVSAATLYAKWTAATHVVTYDVDGGSAVADGSFTTGGTLTLPEAPTKSGNAFAGWFENASGGSALVSGYSPDATGPITIYARWTPLIRTVTFNANGGSGSMDAQSSASAAELTLSTISRSGHGFTGWNTSADGTGTAYAVDATFPFTENTTLYAQWRTLPSAPVAEIEIQVPVGSAIADAPVLLEIDGLLDRSGYTVTVYSTPQIIDQGTIWSGRLNTTVRIPGNLEAGWHRLVIEGTAADGTPWTEENFFEVSPTGILLETSEDNPADLASTGSDSLFPALAAMLLILLGVVFLYGRKKDQSSKQ
jgi:LPXTG-motif cell wall-anchored protein